MDYALQIDLRVTSDADFDLAADVEKVVGHLFEIEQAEDDLLDASVGLNVMTGHLEVEMTVVAESQGHAVDRGLTLLRSAIHASGGNTPGWEGDGMRECVAAFAVGEPETKVVRIREDATV